MHQRERIDGHRAILQMIKVFVSGCYDILHAGHIQFFKDARALGNHLTVCIADDATIRQLKRRTPAMSLAHRIALIGSLRMVDEVVVGTGSEPSMNFLPQMAREHYDFLAVTEDDENRQEKIQLCRLGGIKFAVLPKRPHGGARVTSTTQIRERIAAKA